MFLVAYLLICKSLFLNVLLFIRRRILAMRILLVIFAYQAHDSDTNCYYSLSLDWIIVN